MAELNWGLIRSGATFEGLVSSLVFFEDPGATLFGRPGKDDAQDVRSADTKTIYQAKFHQGEPTGATAIADAKAEVAKIGRYRSEEGVRKRLWQDVEHWVLVTNAVFNPRDDDRWQREVVPLFEKIGLSAEYWERADVEARLHRYPELKRAYFEGETRVFLSLAEARRLVQKRDKVAHPRALEVALQGRAPELERVQQFLASERLALLLHGPGGAGKTRLLLEVAVQKALPSGWQVLWANIESLQASGSWFSALIPEKSTLLLVDEPEDPGILKILFEQVQLRPGRASGWKLAITVRSPKDPVVRYLQGPRVKHLVEDLKVAALDDQSAQAYCLGLLEAGPLAAGDSERKKHAAARIASQYNHFPVWISLAVRLLEQRGDLSQMPETVTDLAEQYLHEIIHSQDRFLPATLELLLRWLALLRTVNTEDLRILGRLQDEVSLESESQVRRAINALAERDVLLVRGARNRLVEVKPDVVADHILREWLTEKLEPVGTGERAASPEATALVEAVLASVRQRTFGDMDKAILRSLGRVEFIQRWAGEPVTILDRLLSGIRTDAPTWNAGQQLELIDVLGEVAPVRVADVVGAAEVLLDADPDPEVHATLLGDRTVRHEDVVLALPWLLFRCAMYAQEAKERRGILDLLLRLVAVEERIGAATPHGLRKDGKRASALLPRIIGGEDDSLPPYADEATEIAQTLLEELGDGQPADAWSGRCVAVLGPLLAVERRRMSSSSKSLTISTYATGPGSPEWSHREQLRQTMRTLLASQAGDLSHRLALWKLLADTYSSCQRAHRGYLEHRSNETETIAALRDDLLDDLRWTLALIERGEELPIQELKAAREMWSWHHRFDEDGELSRLASECDALYGKTKLAAEFEPLVGRAALRRGQREAARAKGQELAAATTAEKIASFVRQGIEYLGEERQVTRLFSVANALGPEAPERPVLQEFIRSGLARDPETAEFQFAAAVANSWLYRLRDQGGESVAERLQVLIGWAGDGSRIVRLLGLAYGSAWGVDVGPEEFEVVATQFGHFDQNSNLVVFLGIVGCMPYAHWGLFKSAAERALDRLEGEGAEELLRGIQSLIDALNLTVRAPANETQQTVNQELGRWAADQVLRLPDIDELGSSSTWNLRDLCKRCGPLPLGWLCDAIDRRIRMADMKGEQEIPKIVPMHERLSGLVAPIPETGEVPSETHELVERLLGHATRPDLLGYILPEYVHDVDPHGRVLPTLVADQLKQEAVRRDHFLQLRWAQFAGAYPENSPAWRAIAHEACAVATGLPSEEKFSVMQALTDMSPQGWFSKPGEVGAIFVEAVEAARRRLEEEDDPALRPFWQWRLEYAENRLANERERAKERRGE